MNKHNTLILLCLFSLTSCVVMKPPQCDLEQPDCLRQTYAAPSRYWPKPTVDDGVEYKELKATNRTVFIQNKKAVELGKTLFFDPRLSSDNTISCASCHQPQHGFADTNKVSFGVMGRTGRRNAPSLLHLYAGKQEGYFWDGRAETIEKQAVMPIADTNEMNMPLNRLPERLYQLGYEKDFQEAFNAPIDLETIGQALAEYEKTIRPEKTRFDQFLEGSFSALTDQEIWGLHLFRTKGRCMNCHYGEAMTDGKFHNLNETYYGRDFQDLGKYEITQNPDDYGKFKTPGLRGLNKTKPWFHHGLYVNLRGVVNIYNMGMPRAKVPDNADEIHKQNHLDPLIKPLNMTREEMNALTKFLETL